MTLKIIVFEKKRKILNKFTIFLSLAYYLPILFKERVFTTILAFEKGSIEHILSWGAKYGFTASTAFSRKF